MDITVNMGQSFEKVLSSWNLKFSCKTYFLRLKNSA